MKYIIRHLIDTLVMDIDSIQDAEIERMRIALARMEGKNKRKSVKGSFSVKKKLRAAPITKRMRSTRVTPRTAKKPDTRTSRSRQMQPRQLAFGSVSRSRSISRPKSMNIDTPLIKSVQYTQTREVRHKNARSKLNKMPRGGKPYANRRMTSRKPKGAYRGSVMPKWAKGETKHALMHDGAYSGATNAPVTTTCASLPAANLASGKAKTDESNVGLGTINSWCLNPVAQGTDQVSRNGRSIDGTYLRIQGHIRNRDENNKAYVRMLVLAVKGGQTQPVSGEANTAKALYSHSNLFKKIDGTIVGFDEGSTAGVSGVSRVRSLQLPVNKALYTVLADQKMQLATTNESFGSSDRLFDLKIPLKQRTKFFDGDAASFESNQIVFVLYTVDPTCADTPLEVSDGSDQGGVGTTGTVPTGLPLEFESKYSYKDF